MKARLQVGLTHQGELVVDENLTVPRVSALLNDLSVTPPVFATAYMIAFVEATCVGLLANYLDAGEQSVGIHVNMSHVAATPVGMGVRAEVTLIAIDKRVLTFKVAAYDASGLIGEGTHKRAVINADRFAHKIGDKAEA